MAPGRAMRPGLSPAVEEDVGGDRTCPFCEGHESETPPETYAVGHPDRSPNAPGWQVRVVPNKFPALSGDTGRHEVVVHTPRHVTSFAELAHGEVEAVAGVWQSRDHAARTSGFGYVHAFVNEGKAAGATLAHTHSQLVWLPLEPPEVRGEASLGGEGCVLCAALASELAEGARVVARADGVVLLCPQASRAPYELLVAPLECDPDAFTSGSRLARALGLASEGIRRIRGLEHGAALNLWLHTFPHRAGHWHVEIVPRLTVFAGLELGAGLYVNPLPPEIAAERLRSLPDRPATGPG